MKTSMPLIGLIFLLLLPGCGQHQEDTAKRISELENRIKDQEQFTRDIRSNIVQLSSLIDTNTDDTIFALKQLRDFAQRQDDNYTFLTNLLISAASSSPQSKPNYSQPRRESTINGIPISIYSQIVADAERHWPTDYEMQAYQIKEQSKAYLELHGTR